MALTKYTKQIPPQQNIRPYLNEELRRVEVSITTIIALLQALEVPIEIGDPDSAGVGYRVLKIPN